MNWTFNKEEERTMKKTLLFAAAILALAACSKENTVKEEDPELDFEMPAFSLNAQKQKSARKSEEPKAEKVRTEKPRA